MPNNLPAPTSLLSAIAPDVYKDLLQPSVKRVGYSLDSLIKVALTPVDIIDWGYEKSRDWLKSKIEERLKRLPPESVVEPSSSIAAVALSCIASSWDTPSLRDLYAELLLKAMDSSTSSDVHPAYFYIIDQLAPKEALALVGLYELHRSELFTETVTPYSSFSKDTKPSIETQFGAFCQSVLSSEALPPAEIWLTNLCRLGILSLNSYSEAIYRPEHGDDYGIHSPRVENHEHRVLSFTDFGHGFVAMCAPLP